MKNISIEQAVDDLTKVITFKIVTTIKNHYGSLEKFKAECGSGSNQALARYNKNFHVEQKVLQALTRTSDGKRRLEEALKRLDPSKLVYKHKYDFKYKKSGKTFSKPSTFYIPFDELERLFKAEHDENTPFSTDSGFYTKRQHKLIDKYVFGYGVKERRPYTKSEKFMKSVRDRQLKKLASKDENGLTDEQMLELVESLDI